MAYIFNSASEFAEESIEGFLDIYSDIVRPVHGGVARSSKTPRGNVAVVIGGGSGHYPAFGGLVGPGLAHGAAMGNVFASPSALQIYSVAKSVENGGGVLLTYGNYAGDVLNFNQAQERLRSEGIACETVAVTDDISSASLAEIHKRRGIAGDLAVFKAAAVAADAGLSLEEVVAVAARANARTRTFGVAFGGATLPGAEDALFSVPAGKMALGMGIHGEPGIGEADMMRARELADLMWTRVLAEKPAEAGDRAVIFVNGLGSVKNEELFVLYNEFRQLAARDGVTLLQPEVGELVTSFEMAGVSLTLFWTDEELESLWSAPAYTPAYRKGSVIDSGEAADRTAEAEEELIVAPATDDSRGAAARIGELIALVAATVDEHAEELGRLDSIAGDGDHGIGMQRGSRAAAAAVAPYLAAGAGAQGLLVGSGDAWADHAGGTSGALWGAILGTLGRSLGNESTPDAASVSAAVRAASDAVMKFGGARPGDKTMVDSLVAFADSLENRVGAGSDLVPAWVGAAADATRVARETADMMPKMGRARPHAEKALGTPDPGAISLALIVTAIAENLEKEEN
ncbi:dihydroxyacetone kinase family protein [Mycetocola spongiae]|uniref:dihydroxyacetone kinase family protein n=1 Tax=Mycetocola spongiae TaxID=2859226 RepID=UPI001CF2E24C|nr:dihydroxyacetone kinase family protein [Mycetocola spongiae]UCR90420.1 dihydroxyacetone kinase family protein [Mycetocola spongiae]